MAKRSHLSPELVGRSVRAGADLVAGRDVVDRVVVDRDAAAEQGVAEQLAAVDRRDPERLAVADLHRLQSRQRHQHQPRPKSRQLHLHLPSPKRPQRRLSRLPQSRRQLVKVNRQHRADNSFS